MKNQVTVIGSFEKVGRIIEARYNADKNQLWLTIENTYVPCTIVRNQAGDYCFRMTNKDQNGLLGQSCDQNLILKTDIAQKAFELKEAPVESDVWMNY